MQLKTFLNHTVLGILLLNVLTIDLPIAEETTHKSEKIEKIDEVDGISVFRKEIPEEDLVFFRGEGIIDAPILKVVNVIIDEDRTVEWVDDVVESKVLKIINPREFFIYTHVGTPFIVEDRDFLTLGKISTRHGHFEMKLDSVENSILPPGKYVRGDVHMRWNLDSVDEGKRTFLSAEMSTDPKGNIPKWLIRSVQKSWPKNTIQKLRMQAAKPDIQINPKTIKWFD